MQFGFVEDKHRARARRDVGSGAKISPSFDRCRIFTHRWMTGLLIRLKRALLVHQQLHEFGMNEQFFPARLPFGKHADPHQFF